MKTYSVREIKKIIKESSDEFKPVLGKNVDSTDKKNNKKAYKDIEKETASYNPKSELKKPVNPRKYDFNKGMQDLIYNKDTINKSFSDRAKAQMNGYTSVQNQNLHKNEAYGNATYGLDTKEIEQKVAKNAADEKAAALGGLVTRTRPQDYTADEVGKSIMDKNISEEKTIKRLHFKRTKFLSENHMFKKIPDDYKKDGMKFIMEDYTGNRYKIEWNENTPTILEHTDKKTLNEQMSKIYSLFNTSKEVKQSTSKQSTINNENTLNEMINKTRKM